MDCTEAQQLLHGYLDDELDLVTCLAVDRHVQECPACAEAYRRGQSLRHALRGGSLAFAPPAGLRERVRAGLRRADGAKPLVRGAPRRRLAVAASLAAGLLLGLVFAGGVLLVLARTRAAGPYAGGDAVAEQVVASHARSLLADHLKDVDSTDQHTVKPWLSRRLDYGPPVVNLKDEGFPLVGGRLDYVDDRAVATLVYQRHEHIINLFVWPSTGPGDSATQTLMRQGYNLAHWTRGGMTYWAVSDLNAGELQTFARLLQP